MSLQSDFNTYLLSKTSITNICSTKIYHGNVPIGIALPAITWNIVDRDHQHCLSGSSGYCRAVMEIVCWSNTNTQAFDLAEKVRLVLQGYKGTMGTTVIGSIILDRDQDTVTSKSNSSDGYIYGVNTTYLIGFLEAIPSFA